MPRKKRVSSGVTVTAYHTRSRYDAAGVREHSVSLNLRRGIAFTHAWG